MQAKQDTNIIKIVRTLRFHAGGLWIREIARQTNLHMETVRRLIDKHPQVFSEYADFTSYKINLKIVRLADNNITEKNVMKKVNNAKKQ